MAIPGSLPQRVFLLAHDPDKGRPRRGTNLGALLRAAALADLYVHGHLTDDRGRAVLVTRRPCHDPVLESLLDEIARSRPHHWHSWIKSRQNAAVSVTRQQLSDGGWVRLAQHRFLGLFPTVRVSIRDHRVRTELRGRLDQALRIPLDRVDPADAALVAVVAAGDLGLALDRGRKRTNKRRIQQLTEVSGPVGPALRKALWDAALGE